MPRTANCEFSIQQIPKLRQKADFLVSQKYFQDFLNFFLNLYIYS